MPWTAWNAPAFVGAVVWENAPSERTAMSADNFNASQNAPANYAADVGQSVYSQITGQLPAPEAIVQTPVGVAEQDILVRSGGTWARLAIGTTDQLLVVRSDGTLGYVDAPVVYAQAWGLAAANSATLNSTNLQAAVNHAKTTSATLQIHAGTFSYNGVQVRDQQGLTIRGKGTQSTILQVAANNAIGLDIFGSTGTGDCADIHISDLQVTYSAAGVTAARFWNCQPFSLRRCILKADLCGLSIQGSFVGTCEDSRIYLLGSNTIAQAAVWLGSGKSAPHVADASVTANITNLSTSVTNISPGLPAGYTYTVQGAGIPGGTTIPGTKITITGVGTTGTLSAPATATTVGAALTMKAITLSGNGNLRFGSCVIESANGPAIVIEDNTAGTLFETCELNALSGASGAFNGVVEIDSTLANDSIGAAVTFDRCYQEGSNFGGADFALGTYENHCNRVMISGHESTGSSGMACAVDVAACDHLTVHQLQAGNYTVASIRFRAGYLAGLIGATKAQLRCEQIDNSGATGTPIYVDADGHIPSTYRGPIVRTNTWRHVLVRIARFDASVVTGAGTYPVAQSNPTAAGTGDANEGLAWFYFDPADYGYAPLRVRLSILTNATAPGTTISAGLVPQSGNPGGGAGTVTQANGAFVMASASIATPAAATTATAVSAIGYITTAGWYALAVSPSAAFAASSSVAVALRLEAMN